MKLRIRDDSLRLRLTRDEVRRVAAGEAVAGRMSLPAGSAFEYRLSGAAEADVTLNDRRLSVTLPGPDLVAWASGDAVSLHASCPTHEAALAVLVEKDFACLSERPGDDDADTFPHPEAGRARC